MNPLELPSIDADEAFSDPAAFLLDVRENDEWRAGHAANAVHIPLGEVVGRVDELPRDRRIVCVCRSGNRSGRVTAWLLEQGFDAVNMRGGMTHWAAFGHPLVNQTGALGVVI